MKRLETLLEKAIQLDGAAKGNIQVLDPAIDALRIAVHCNFDQAFLQHFETVKPFDASACGRASGLVDCVVIPDVNRDEAFAPHRAIARRTGFRSVKSIPLVGPDGRVLGVISTHAPEVRHDWDRRNTLQVVEEIAAILADASWSLRADQHG